MLRFLNELENLKVSLKLQKGQFLIKFIFRLVSFSNEFVYLLPTMLKFFNDVEILEVSFKSQEGQLPNKSLSMYFLTKSDFAAHNTLIEDQ